VSLQQATSRAIQQLEAMKNPANPKILQILIQAKKSCYQSHQSKKSQFRQKKARVAARHSIAGAMENSADFFYSKFSRRCSMPRLSAFFPKKFSSKFPKREVKHPILTSL
jgi:hypothetical protein